MKKILFILFIITFSSEAFSDDKMILGLKVYKNKAMCGTCHILKSAETHGQIGPNLDQLKPQLEQIISTVTNGIGVMPSFEDTLTLEEIEAVAYYVFNKTNN